MIIIKLSKMATSKATAEYFVEQLSEAGEIRIRSMMGEYLLYVDDILVGQINNENLFIKVTSFGESQLADDYKTAPYPGAKPAFKIPADKVNDIAWLNNFVKTSQAELRKSI
jgi:DNA transformation protein